MSAPRFFHLLAVAQRRLQRHADAGLADLGLTQTQAGLLFVVAPGKPISLSAAATALDLAPSAITGLVERMERAGLVERRPDPHDGRVQQLHLMAKGEALRTKAAQRARTFQRVITEGFTADEVAAAARFLETMIARLPAPGHSKGEM